MKLPEEKMIPKNTPIPEMDKALSILSPAMTRVGTPLSVPSFRSDKFNMQGTTTEGDTPAKMNLKENEIY